MIQTAKIALVFVLVACIVTCGLPRPSYAQEKLPHGTTSSSAAAALPASEPARATSAGMFARTVAAGEPVLAFGALGATAEPDTSEFEFPDDGEKHLARDITMWAIASAFVAFFIVKVFIEKDADEPKDNTPPGKQI